MQDEARIAYFGPPNSSLHRQADFSIPLSNMEFSDEYLMNEILKAERRGIVLDGLLTWRDGNVLPVAKVAARLGLACPEPSLLEVTAKKSNFRGFLNDHLGQDTQTLVRHRALDQGMTRSQFAACIEDLFSSAVSALILKPDRGSCSYLVLEVRSRADLDRAWDHYVQHSCYRGGAFILEEKLIGRECSVETLCNDAGEIVQMWITEYMEGRKGEFWERGHFVPHEFSNLEEMKILKLAREIHHKLQLRNIATHLEIILPEDCAPGVVEFNARLAGDLTQELFRLATGESMYHLTARMALGLRLEPRPYFSREQYNHCALIEFANPALRRRQNFLQAELETPDDLLCILDADQSTDKNNDSRPGFTLLVGKTRSALEGRSHSVLNAAFE